MTLPCRALPLALLVVLPAACGPSPSPTPPPAPSAAPAAPAADDGAARHAADTAIASLSKRKFNVAGCSSTDTRVVPEAQTSAAPTVSETCTLLVAHRADGAWIVVVRSPTQTGNVWAVVTVAASGEGVQHIDYKP